MIRVTIQILEGLERGQIFQEITLPVRLGREEENEIRLNDERISRFHARIQSDGEQVILTDLDSTNGTRVNGSPIHIRVLKPGDLITLGRCLLLFGSADEIRQQRRLSSPVIPNAEDRTVASADGELPMAHVSSAAGENGFVPETDLFPGGPPNLPEGLTTVQKAQLSDLMSFTHERLARVLSQGVEITPPDEETPPSKAASDRVLPWERWQDMIELERQLSEYLRTIAEPDSRPNHSE